MTANNEYPGNFVKVGPVKIRLQTLPDETYNNAYWLSVFLVELTVLALAVLCFWHAGRQGFFQVLVLSHAIFFGIVIEYIFLTALKGRYAYGRFFLTIKDILPICVGISWGLIIYAVVHTTTLLHIPWFVAPFVDAFLAICLDAIVDPIAVHAGMWSWKRESITEKFWFGVPVSNFYGWFCVILTYSFAWRLFNLWYESYQPEMWWTAVVSNLAILVTALISLLLWRGLLILLTNDLGISHENLVRSIMVVCALITALFFRPNESMFQSVMPLVPIALILLLIVVMFIGTRSLRPKRFFVLMAFFSILLFWLPLWMSP